MKIALHIEIERPPEKVFPWLSDPGRAKTWMTSVTDTEILHETPERVGTRFRERVEENGRGTELVGEITGFTENRSIAFHLEGTYNSVDLEYRLGSSNTHTRLSFVSSIRFKSFTRVVMLLLGPWFKRKIVRQLESQLGNLKEICERED
jgi:uncharacterized protein YndB with AHSA1/START domain